MKHQKKGFLILSVIILVVAFSYLSITIIQNQTFSSQVDKLKYLEIQGKIYMDTYLKYIHETNNEGLILNYRIDDARFNCKVESEHLQDVNGSEIINYHITIEAKEEPIRFVQSVEMKTKI